MPGQLGSLPGREPAVQLEFGLGQTGFQFADLVLDRPARGPGPGQLFDPFLDFPDRLFKLQIVSHRTVLIRLSS